MDNARVSAPHELDPTRRRRRLPTILAVIAVLVVALAGVVTFRPGLLGEISPVSAPPEVDGQIVWSSQDRAVQLGPAGWLTHPGEDGGHLARNVRTGESWVVGDLAPRMSIAQDGTVVQPVEQEILVQREGATHTTSTSAIRRAFGDDDLWPGTNSELVALSETHVAVITCLAPRPSAVTDDVAGGLLVLAGIRLADGSVDWTLDTGAGCGPASVTRGKPGTLPAQRYVLLEPREGTAMAVDIDSGTVARRWPDARPDDIVVQGEHVLAPRGEDTVTWSSLRTGREIAAVECRGARADDPGDHSRQLSPAATPVVTCWESVHALSGDRFVEIPAPPASGGVPLDEGVEVAHGPLVLRREGPVVHVRDGLTGRSIGGLDVPQDFEIARFVPKGRLLAFAQWTSGDRSTASYRVFDTEDGSPVITTTGGMRTGASASPEGVVMVTSQEDLSTTWVALAKGAG